MQDEDMPIQKQFNAEWPFEVCVFCLSVPVQLVAWKDSSPKWPIKCRRDVTRNTLDCDQSNYSSRIVYTHMRIEFGQTGNSAIRSADLENPILEPNTE